MGAIASLYKYTSIDNNDKKKMQDVMTSMHYRGVQYLDVNVSNCILSQLNSFHNGFSKVYAYKDEIYVVADISLCLYCVDMTCEVYR
jgi:cytosine/uracil/thiamine/allantoin permease